MSYDAWKTTPPYVYEDDDDGPEPDERPYTPPRSRRARARRAMTERLARDNHCGFHCNTVRHERALYLRYRRLAQRFYAEGNDSMRSYYAGLARTAWDVAHAIREKVPHMYLGGLSYGYEPADPDAKDRRIVARIG